MTERHRFPWYEGREFRVLNPKGRTSGSKAPVMFTFDGKEYREKEKFWAPAHMDLSVCLKEGFVERVNG